MCSSLETLLIHLYKFNENWIFKLGEIKIPGMDEFNRK